MYRWHFPQVAGSSPWGDLLLVVQQHAAQRPPEDQQRSTAARRCSKSPLSPREGDAQIGSLRFGLVPALGRPAARGRQLPRLSRGGDGVGIVAPAGGGRRVTPGGTGWRGRSSRSAVGSAVCTP